MAQKKVEPQTPDQNDTLFAPKAVTEEKKKESWEVWAEEQEKKRKTMNIFQKIQDAKVKVQNRIEGKSGNNSYVGFKYLELADFLPIVNDTFNDLGLFERFRIDSTYDENGAVHDVAILDVINSDNPQEKVTYSMRCEVPQMKNNSAMQCIGSMHTYARRYLYIELLSLAIPDDLDAKSGKDEFRDAGITEDQKKILTGLMVELPEKADNLLDHYKAKTIEDLTMVQASEAIKTMKAYKAKRANNVGTSNNF